MKVVISQPMLFPWVGLLEQVRLADVYVNYTDVQFSKGSFVNRVQVKTANGSRWMTVPLADLHLGQRIDQVRPSDKRPWREEHLALLADAYTDAPYRDAMLDLVRGVYAHDYADIGALATASLLALCEYFDLDRDCRFVDIDELGIGDSGSTRVLKIVRSLGGTRYITGHGAARYLDHAAFDRTGIAVEYMDYTKAPYPQLHGEFTPFVSALDLIANTGSHGKKFICPRITPWKDFPTHERNRAISD
ncbi:WbqC family protein [Solilutibacter silvestris]|uniref:WbqC-like protein n=1 Tax=Solilutibacter silvestris TaxID=1645665 RepID=A0A2K1Q2N7_9GAMM|nr:WbqC family protein [Lysobacter silvestris]PNS09302.1 WbqC-like protein [Lysobacter silvestris]